MPIMKSPLRVLAALALPLCLSFGALSSALADTVTVYSARNEQLLKPLLDRYTKETGTEIKLLTANEGALLARLQAEGQSTPADVLITVDAGNLWLAAQQGQLQPLKSSAHDRLQPAVGQAFGTVHLRGSGPTQMERQALSAYQQEGLQPVADCDDDQ
jgi:ABC-type glycerol-3-phosphate transport system substrate-binding protein